MNWLYTTSRIDKEEIERIHVQRFAADCRRATGGEAYAAIEANDDDPPDFLVSSDDGNKKGLECAAFSIEERRAAQALFSNFKTKLALQQRHRIGHLTGSSVLTWFGTEQNPDSRPPRKSDGAAAEELIDALSNYRPDMDSLRAAFSRGMPPQMPAIASGQTLRNATFYSIPFLSAVPTGPFMSVTGYDIALAYTTTHTVSTVCRVVEKLVADHDKEGVDTLLITSGGPDRQGVLHPAEQVVSDFYLKNSRELKTKFISSVVLHRWPSGDAYELLGISPKRLWSPIYRDYLPAHQPLSGDQTSVREA
jgi:hypothetical protein